MLDHAARVASAPPGGIRPNFASTGTNLIRLGAGAFDPLAAPLPSSAVVPLVSNASLPSNTPLYFLAQVKDRRFAEAYLAINVAGGSVDSVMPDDAYVVRATTSQRAVMDAANAIRWTGFFQPAWRVAPTLANSSGTAGYRVYGYRKDPKVLGLAAALSRIPGVTVISDGGATVDVKATATQLGAMAVIPYVDWITPSPLYVPLNYNARWVVDTGVRDLFSATADNGATPTRLNGAGQTAADADTPLNYTNNSAGFAHVAFRDGCDAQGQHCMLADYTQVNPGQVTPAAMTNVQQNHAGTNHRKMVAYFDLGGSGIDSIDGDAHGSHTAGSIDGDAGTPGVYDGNDGLAPAAHHVHQNIMTQAGGLNLPGGLALPTDYYQLFRQAYRPDNPGSVSTTGHAATDYTTGYTSTKDARTHNNSYGSIAQIADTGDAIVLDQFVWDHEDMDIAVAAGNAGPGAGTISSPGLAKNDFASAATQNGRQPMVSTDSITNFSSHGPTGDGRFGITVADPGEIVVSVKGGTADGYHYEQGTSMSTPVLTGILTLVRQYFYDGFGPANAKGTDAQGFAAGARNLGNRYNPSAALVKATLVAGAQRMRGWYTGDDGSSQQGSGQPELSLRGQYPSAGQGFGRVNLDTSLAFTGGPLNGWYHDVYRDDAQAFQLTDVGTTKSYTIQVDAGRPLNVAMAYTDAPNDLSAGTPALVNKLNLTVTGPNGETYVGNNFNTRTTPSLAEAEVPNQVAAPDAKNNVEKVRIASPAAGLYTIGVRGTVIRTAGQGFGLAANGAVHAPAGAFVPHDHQVDLPGPPTVSNIQVTPVSGDTVKLTFDTNEPTTATATGPVKTTSHTFGDVAQLTDADRYFGIGSALVEESPATAGKLVLGTKHEMYLTGFDPGSARAFTISVQDLGGSTPTTAPVSFTTPSNIFQTVQAKDQAILTKSGTGFQWETGKQFYAGHSPATLTAAADAQLGAFMFRIPGSFDPSTITGASVEMVSGHDWASEVSDDPIYTLDLLDNTVKAAWGTQTYAQIESAAKLARVAPETDYHVGGNQRYSFTFGCNDLQRLKDSLGAVDGNGQRTAPFRWDATDTNTSAVFSMEFGFNRRSKGVDLRPKLVLRTASSNNEPPLTLCDPNTPAPTISNLGVHPGLSPDSAIVSWLTNVDSDSLVLFREKGTQQPWTQVATPSRTKIHQIWVQGVDPLKTYEFGIRSTACNGASTTDDNAGAGYLLFTPQPTVQPRLSFYFHGTATDDVNRANVAPTATFDSVAPTGGTDRTQTSQNVVLNDPTIAGDPNSPYWISPVGTGTAAFTGTITGNIHLHWWWSSPNAAAIQSGSQMDITVWADKAPGTTGQQPIGSASPRINMGAQAVLNDNDIPVNGTVSTELIIQATPHFVDTGQGNLVHYDSTAAPSMFTIPVGPLPPPPPGGPGPKVGPKPPLTAGDSGLQLASIQADGMPTAADTAAGTGLCAAAVTGPVIPEVPAAVLLPMLGLVVVGVPFLATRRRRRRAA